MLLTEWNDDEYREVIREEAIEDGRAEGLAQGRAEERTEVARGMKAKGFSAADVADITGLSEEVIAAL